MGSNMLWGGARRWLLKAALGLGVLAFASPAAAAKTITVATTTDTAPSTTTGPCSLRMAIERASETVSSNSCVVSGSSGGWVIDVPASATAYAITGLNGAFRIRKPMTIQGKTANYTSTKITGSPSGGGVFVVDWGLTNPVTLNLKNMRVTNAQDLDVDGSALNIQAPSSAASAHTVNLNTVQFDNCKSWVGGAVRNSGATLTITNSYLHDNKASVGGAIASERAFSVGTLTVTNSTISNNRADQNGGSGYGGGIYMSGGGTFTNTTIDSNIAVTTLFGGDGGGIYAFGTGAVVVDKSTVSNNQGRNGGGMYEANPAALSTHNTTVSGNSASMDGGGIWAANYLEMFNTTVAKNRAYNGTGGGVYFLSASSGARTNACIIADNNKGTSTLTPQDYKGSPHNGGASDARSLFGVITETVNPFTVITHPSNPDLVGNPNLGVLASNGGPTKTHAIGATSLAYNAEINNNNAQSQDQRGTARPQAGVRDLGAFEYKP
jgi:hypothetical protein